jgi:TRAP-type transport system periplasmic protein
VTVTGGAQLGDEAQLLENMRIGTVDCAGASVGQISGHIPALGLLSVPYIIEGDAHRERIVDDAGPVFQKVAEIVADTGEYRALGMTTAGVRSVYTNVGPIETPEDLAGLKIRTMTSDVQVRSWEALGALPTALPFADVYSALRTGVIDGAENSPMFLWNMQHYEGAQYFSLTQHMVATGVTMLSERAYQRLPEDLRDIVMAAGAEATRVGRFYDEAANRLFMDRVIEAGVQVNEVDLAPFVERVRPLHDEFAAQLGAEDLLALIREEVEAAR